MGDMNRQNSRVEGPPSRYDQLREDYEWLRVSHRNVSEQFRVQQQVNTQTKMELQECKNRLVACYDEISSLQPPNQVSDEVIQNSWREICAGIHQWIDNESGHLEDINRLPSQQPLDFAFKHLRNLRSQQHGRPLAFKTLDYVLCYIIHEVLYSKILAQENGLLGLRSKDIDFLATLKANLGNEELRRGSRWTLHLLKSILILELRSCTNRFMGVRNSTSDVCKHRLCPATRQASEIPLGGNSSTAERAIAQSYDECNAIISTNYWQNSKSCLNHALLLTPILLRLRHEAWSYFPRRL